MLECKCSFDNARDSTDSLTMAYVGFNGAKYDRAPGPRAKNGRQSLDLNWITYGCASPMSLNYRHFRSLMKEHSFQAKQAHSLGLLNVLWDHQSAHLYIICFCNRQACFSVRFANYCCLPGHAR